MSRLFRLIKSQRETGPSLGLGRFPRVRQFADRVMHLKKGPQLGLNLLCYKEADAEVNLHSANALPCSDGGAARTRKAAESGPIAGTLRGNPVLPVRLYLYDTEFESFA